MKSIILFPLKFLWVSFKLSFWVLLGIVIAIMVITFFPFVATTGGLIGIAIYLIWWMNKKSEENEEK
tara:strand:- start:83 stop:283 length:201 start_codon:yes stop_codon:yes gene_type:complete